MVVLSHLGFFFQFHFVHVPAAWYVAGGRLPQGMGVYTDSVFDRTLQCCFPKGLQSQIVDHMTKLRDNAFIANTEGLHRLVVRTSRRGRDNPGSSPGVVNQTDCATVFSHRRMCWRLAMRKM